MGTALDNLLQTGKMGVLDGAEKFDSRKGCRFYTYVKYWIRKGMLALLAENSGVTLLPAGAQVLLQGRLALLGDRDQTAHKEVIPDEAASPEAPNEATLFWGQLRERLLLVLGRLPAREGQVLRLRHKLEDGRCRSLEEIGSIYRVSKEWIRKIKKPAMEKLRDDEDVRRDLHDFVCHF